MRKIAVVRVLAPQRAFQDRIAARCIDLEFDQRLADPNRASFTRGRTSASPSNTRGGSRTSLMCDEGALLDAISQPAGVRIISVEPPEHSGTVFGWFRMVYE